MCTQGARCHESPDSDIMKIIYENINNLHDQVILDGLGN